MLYASTRHSSHPVSFVEAMWHPYAPDGGLYLPEKVPVLPRPVLANMSEMTMAEIAYVVFNACIGEVFSSAAIKELVERVYSFPVPLVNLDENTAVMELFEGPTLAYKDFGARVVARLLSMTAAANGGRPVNVMICTTGNTGSAMATALAGMKGINVFIVFPRGTATRALENQFTTLGGNIYPIEVSGTLDACSTLVATALGDAELNNDFTMLSVNSANIARLLGQTVYYFYGVSRLLAKSKHSKEVVVSVPCGNLGNLTTGLLAKRMGLGIKKFIACENNNDYLRRALIAEDFKPRSVVPTLAYAADKSVPINLERILDLYPDSKAIMNDIIPVSVSDPEIIEAINDCYDRYGYLIDTHTALAYYGLRKEESCFDTQKTDGLILATAHPAKSLTAMTAITGRPIEMPVQLNRFMGRPDFRTRIRPVYSSLKKIILSANKK